MYLYISVSRSRSLSQTALEACTAQVQEQQHAWEASQNATATLVKQLMVQGGETRAAVFLAHIMYVLIRFRKSTPPHNRQLIVYYY